MKNISRKVAKFQTKAQRRILLLFAPSSAPLRLCVKCLLLVLLLSANSLAQTKSGSHSSHPHPSMSADAKKLLDEAIGVVCTQAKLDPKSSIAIDEMQARPSLEIQSPEARAGAERAERLLPVTKSLMIAALEQLASASDQAARAQPRAPRRHSRCVATSGGTAPARTHPGMTAG